MSTIPFSDVLDWQTLPIDAQDVVTKVRLVVAGNLAGRAPQRITAYATDDPDTTEAVDYVPWPITVVYEAPEHAIYGAERSFALPTGLNPFLAPTSDLIPEPVAVSFNNPGAPSVVRDGDPETSAEYTAGVGDIGWVRYPFVENAVGMRVKFTLATVAATADNATRTHASITLSPRASGARFYGSVFASTGSLADAAEPAELYMVVPPHANWATENGAAEAPHDGIYGQAAFETFTNVSACNLIDCYPLVLNMPLLLDIARSQVRIPAQTPRRVTVAGTLPPGEMEHTITGWPGGTYTGQVARQTYRGGETVVDFEQAGAPPGVPQEALEAERVRVARTRQVVDSAGYSLKMGERQ